MIVLYVMRWYEHVRREAFSDIATCGDYAFNE